MRSIRTTITAITIVAILTSFLSVFAASQRILQSESDQNSVSMMNLIDRDAQKSLEKYFESIEQSVEVAANIAIEDMDSVYLAECGVLNTASPASARSSVQAAALSAYLSDYCGRIQQHFSSVADYTQGVSSYFYFIDPEISRSERGFVYSKAGKTGFVEQPTPDVSLLPADETLGVSWYEAAVGMGCPGWVGPYLYEEEWVCSYFVPIYKSGILIGVMGMDIPCDTLVSQVDGIQVYETGYVCLLDAKGHVIYHPDYPIGSTLEGLDDQLHREVLVNENSGDQLFRYSDQGKQWQISFSTLSNGMKLVSAAPTGEINAPWSRLIGSVAWIAAVVVVFYVILVYFIMRAIARPLEQLTDASRRLANAEYDVDLNYQGNNEIGTLTHSFNRMREQLRRYIDDLNHQIYHDRLTDLPNMRHFFTLAQQERQKLLDEGRQPAMVSFDIIGLGQYNRQNGFEKGDQRVTAFARILVEQFGQHCVCRYSGDQFMAVADEAAVEKALQAVLQACQQGIDGEPIHVRVGVYPNRLEQVDINVACDRAKYAGDLNKGERSSSITYYDERMLKKEDVSRHIINNLDRALQEGWVRVYYQPIVRTADSKVCDEEALARWIDPALGFLSPGDFIPALESSKLIYKLDLYVLEQVLLKLKQQAEAGVYLVPQSVNLSRMDFESCDIVEEIRRRVDDAGIARSLITIEITESVIGGDFAFMKQQVEHFQALGFPVWMDDFGSGYSSLDVLQQIHFDLIKFDMRFMERFEVGDESRIILTELMKMAIGLGTETVCEGVEQREQVDFLREIGCTKIQGYYYGTPLPFDWTLSQVKRDKELSYENPEESDYYASIGRVNLYDISALSSENDDSLSQYFNTLPMCIIEVNGTVMQFLRCNRSYRDFMQRALDMDYNTEPFDTADPRASRLGAIFLKAVLQCSREGSRMVVDEKVSENAVVHAMIRRVAVNPVTGSAAVAVAVLAVSRDASDGTETAGQGSADGEYAPQYLAQEASKVTELKNTVESLLNNMPCMTFSKLAETGVYLACNQSFAEYAHKKTPAQVVGLTDAEIFDAETAAHFVQDDQKAISMDRPHIFFEDVLDAGGNQRQFQTTKLKYIDFSGRLCLLGMSQDVTDMVRIQREHEETKEACEQALSSVTIFTHIAQALARGTTDLYYVNMDTDEFIEYHTDDTLGVLTEARHDTDFFEGCERDARLFVHQEDQAAFVEAMNRDFLNRALDQSKVFELIYRRIKGDRVFYVRMRVSRIEDDRRFIVISVSDIDELMHKRRLEERMMEERTIYARLHAISGNYICIYVVDPQNGNYREFSSSADYDKNFAQEKEGSDFFETVREKAKIFNAPEDLELFLSVFTKKHVMEEVARSGIFTLTYRLLMDGKPTYTQMKAAMVEEKEGPRLIVGLNDVDAQVRQEQEFGRRLIQARELANVDALTGVKNRHAYVEVEERMNRQITEQTQQPFSVVMLDVNNLKTTNDTYGHQAGDKLLRDACKIICDTFQHSPVFRVGGDEFAVISQGSDYERIDQLVEQIHAHNREAVQNRGVVIACGMSKFADDLRVNRVFERADQKMYENKKMLKSQSGLPQ